MEELYYHQGAFFAIKLKKIRKEVKQGKRRTARKVSKYAVFFSGAHPYLDTFHTLMISFAELYADEKIRKIATVKHDSKIISITSDELVEREAKYHASCHKDYTSPEKQLAGNKDPTKTDILKTVVKKLLEKSDDKIVCLSEVKTKYILYPENSDIDFKNADKKLKCSIEKNLSNIKLLLVDNKDITYPDFLLFEDVGKNEGKHMKM